MHPIYPFIAILSPGDGTLENSKQIFRVNKDCNENMYHISTLEQLTDIQIEQKLQEKQIIALWNNKQIFRVNKSATEALWTSKRIFREKTKTATDT